MAIHLVLGSQGGGKTLFCLKQCILHYRQGMQVYSNFRLKIPHKIITFKDIVDVNLSNCCLFLDEAHLWGLNSRQSQSKKNTIITSQFLVQLRKKRVICYMTTQRPRQIDVRCRENSDTWCWCTKYRYDVVTKRLVKVRQSEDFDPRVPIIINVDVWDCETDREKSFRFLANPFYRFYDTEEVIKVQELDEKHKTKKKDKES